MLLPRLDVIDLNYTTLYPIADDVVFHVHVPRTPAAETVGRHLDSSFIIFPDYNVVIDVYHDDDDDFPARAANLAIPGTPVLR